MEDVTQVELKRGMYVGTVESEKVVRKCVAELFDADALFSVEGFIQLRLKVDGENVPDDHCEEQCLDLKRVRFVIE